MLEQLKLKMELIDPLMIFKSHRELVKERDYLTRQLERKELRLNVIKKQRDKLKEEIEKMKESN